MDRLTFEGNFCDIAKCEFVPGGSFCEGGSCSQREVWERLKAYEDTGLTPGEVKQMSNILLDVGQDYNLRWEHVKNWLLDTRLRELFEADKDGRVIVLPCKVGDTLFRVFAGEILEHRVGSMKYFAIQGRWDIETYPFCPCVESSIGKTIFLTREEAEQALKEAERND